MTETETRIFAVDWSGKKKGAAESIWTAEAANGQVVFLENGLQREQLIARLIMIADKHPHVIVGFDFAFSMPAWYIHHHLATNTPEFWEIVTCAGESWLETCPWPFYGCAGKKKPSGCELLRETEKKAPGAKSTFLVDVPGAVGTGSVRGMPFLLGLRSAGWRIWPFDPPGFPMAMEIYPRLLAPRAVKKVWRKRRDYLTETFPGLDSRYLERAAGSEDAFDAAVSALIMDKHRVALLNLPDSACDTDLLEGQIWHP